MRKVLYLLGVGAVLGGCSVAGEDLYSDVVFADDEPEVSLTDEDLSHETGDDTGSDGSLGSPDGSGQFETWEVDGYVSCDALGFYGAELLTIDEVETGDYEVNEAIVSVTMDSNSLDFSSTTGVRAVIVFGGTGAVVRAFGTDTLEQTGLHAPLGEFAPHPITGVSFCAVQ